MRVDAVWRKAWVVFLVLTLMALVVRLAWLGRKSMWLDEVYSLNRALLSVTQIVETQGDPHPPLFYVGLHYWLVFGHDEFTLRLPSAMWGAVSVGLIYLLGKRWAGTWTGIAFAILLAIAPIHVWFSQEARMYAASCTLGLMAVWLLSEAIATGRWIAWAGWIVATVLGLYTHYLTLVLLLIELVLFGPVCYWLGVLRRRMLSGTLALVGVMILYAPWFQRLGGELGRVVDGVLWYFTPVSGMLATSGAHVTARQLFNVAMVASLIGVVLLLLLSWKVVSAWKQRTFSPGMSIATAMILLYAIALVASVWPKGYSLRRQVLIFFPYFLVMVAWSISGLGQRNVLMGGLVAITIPFLAGNLVLTQQQDWRSLARFMEQQALPEDVILFSAPYYSICLDYYYRGSVERAGVAPTDVPSRLFKLTQARAHVWLILIGEEYTDPGSTIPTWLDAQRRLTGEHKFVGIRVRLYGATTG